MDSGDDDAWESVSDEPKATLTRPSVIRLRRQVLSH